MADCQGGKDGGGGSGCGSGVGTGGGGGFVRIKHD